MSLDLNLSIFNKLEVKEEGILLQKHFGALSLRAKISNDIEAQPLLSECLVHTVSLQSENGDFIGHASIEFKEETFCLYVKEIVGMDRDNEKHFISIIQYFKRVCRLSELLLLVYPKGLENHKNLGFQHIKDEEWSLYPKLLFDERQYMHDEIHFIICNKKSFQSRVDLFKTIKEIQKELFKNETYEKINFYRDYDYYCLEVYLEGLNIEIRFNSVTYDEVHVNEVTNAYKEIKRISNSEEIFEATLQMILECQEHLRLSTLVNVPNKYTMRYLSKHLIGYTYQSAQALFDLFIGEMNPREIEIKIRNEKETRIIQHTVNNQKVLCFCLWGWYCIFQYDDSTVVFMEKWTDKEKAIHSFKKLCNEIEWKNHERIVNEEIKRYNNSLNKIEMYTLG